MNARSDCPAWIAIGRPPEKILAWLQKEYPHSPFVKQAAAKAAAAPAAAAETSPPESPSQSQSQAPASQPVFVRGSAISAARGEPSRSNSQAKPLTPASASRIGSRVFDFTNAATASSVVERIRAIKSPLVGIRVGVPSRGVTRVVLELRPANRGSARSRYRPLPARRRSGTHGATGCGRISVASLDNSTARTGRRSAADAG